jgi:lysine 6-dehydrogenase
MRMLVLGGGLQGSACALDLLRHTDAEVTLADYQPDQLPDFLSPYRGKRLAVTKLDAHDTNAVRAVMKGQAAVMSALPYYFNADMAALAVEAGTNFADLGGNTEIVRQQKQLDDAAKAKGLSIMPDCGLAPGMVNILALEGIRRMDKVEAVRLYVGGLPQHPEPPLNYNIVYSLEGVLDYYTTPSWILRNGEPMTVEALSELEDITFPEPVGSLEAFHTAGGISTMPWDFSGSIPVMEYKTLRYHGHAEIMKAIRWLGLLDLAPVTVDSRPVKPRDLFIALADPKLRKPDVHDLVALKVIVTGTKGGKPKTVTFELLDFYDPKFKVSAMMRTTGYSLAITGAMQARGEAAARGVTTSFEGTPFAPYVKALRGRGIAIQESEA